MTDNNPVLRDFIHLDFDRVRSLASQLGIAEPQGDLSDRGLRERLFLQAEPALMARGGAAQIDSSFDFSRWAPDAFADGQFVRASGVVRLLDFAWLSMALDGLPAVLRKMSRIEMEALKISEQGRRMSKSQLQQRSQENLTAISKVEDFKIRELSDAVLQLYTDTVRVKIRPSKDQPACVLVASAYQKHFYDVPAALSQKYGIEIDAGWTVVGQLNVPKLATPMSPIPTGNQIEDAFEQIAVLMNNAFRLANSPAFPALSLTPIAIYRTS